MVNIVSMATEKALITHSSEVGESWCLVQMFIGRIGVAKGIFVPNMKFVRLGTRVLFRFFCCQCEDNFHSNGHRNGVSNK